MLERLARVCYVRRRFVLAGWIVGVVALSVLGSSLSRDFRTAFDLPGSDSQAAADLLEEAGFGSRGTQLSGQIVFTSADGVRSPAVRSSMHRLFTQIGREVDVCSDRMVNGCTSPL